MRKCHVCGRPVTENDAHARLKLKNHIYLICCPMCMTALQAGDVQRRMVPQSFTNDQLAVQVEYLPALQVGGDFACIHLNGEKRAYFIVGDVSGHGITASLLMSWISREIEDSLEAGKDVAAITQRLNLSLRSVLGQEPWYATLFCSMADLPSASITYTNCGHPPPMLWSQRDRKVLRLEPQNIPVGLFGPETFGTPETRAVEFRGGDKLMLFTDGLVDLKREDGTNLGEAGITQVFYELVEASTKETERHIIKRIKSLREIAPHDDLLLILVDRHSGAWAGTRQ